MKPTVFIQANHRQLLGARIAAHSYKSRSAKPDSFNVRIITTDEYPRLQQSGQSILRGGQVVAWNPDDLQSFTPLRFAPPTLMRFQGRAVVTDPDCFAVGDVAELFARDMEAKAIMAVQRLGKGKRPSYLASSVMLLDCAKLKHWDFEPLLDGLFARQFDYLDWVALKLEEPDTLGLLEPEWNSFDQLTPSTKILHTTKRRTQPWKTGLPVDFVARSRGPLDLLKKLRPDRYRVHPDPNQEAFVYSLLAELVDSGGVTKEELVAEMAADHIRHDSLQLVDRYRGCSASAAAEQPQHRFARR